LSRQLLIAPYPATRLSELDGCTYISTVASVGYEPRSIAIARALGDAGRGSAVEFSHAHVLAFEENSDGFRELGWETVSGTEEEFPRWVADFLALNAAGELPSSAKRPRVAVDISSMTRTRIAATVQALAELPAPLQIGVDFLYAPAAYSDPQTQPPAILHRAPVSPYYAGDLAMGETTVLVGLGYEQHKAASTIEDFGPNDVVAFIPEGSDRRYLDAVLDANSGVLEGPLAPTRESYAVEDPFATFRRLEALCFDRLYREQPQTPVLVPLGPKIFAACCLLVGAMHREHVAVWRVSYRRDEPPAAAQAAGELFGLRVDVPLLSDNWSEP
jgi:hypothetical protein